ncbi:hypothetical protein WKR88_04715 [Trinickia caryophylli]|uniref:DUF3604 domain-containing protein n=1 Tax=Trinickia caryophylli TaxID=28094 RepID=A0A1X7FCP9_TRICW|nr:hypothetical protein [Trinickia caryophylli]PMS10863.1 hypothetical protein C0Z17_16925 [Trinickia caryophylli]TRX18806.1 hypothetical protein FNF07_11630 [Trinickia caryophylli]WQE10395.1 hypothetical protein U0034_11285 [Trinickia caryophylli]SMF50073.1 hypothetical protein SAMN06295900_108210 [Trinickia caryophylli]GLU34154.1 DUF3604 domain-containing protein [Trinickia caryophylli]
MKNEASPFAAAYEALRARLGEHVAPQGLYVQNKALPFAGRIECNVERIEAGSWHEIVLVYEVGASGIADGASLKATFKFYSDWALFQTSDPTAANYVSAEYQAGPLVAGQSPATVQALHVRFDQKGHERPFQKAVIVDIVDGYLNAGDRIVIRLGDRRRGPGTRVQTFVEDAFKIRVYVDPLGTSRFVAVPGDVAIAIEPGAASHVVVNGPRFVQPGVPARLGISLQDKWGNVCRDARGAVRVRAYAGERIVYERAHALAQGGWAVAHVGDLPTDRGDLRIVADVPEARDVAAAEARLSVGDFPAPRALYADLHVHAHDTVGTNSPAYNAAYARDIGRIDVFGYTANDFQITDENWGFGVQSVADLHKPGEFVVYPVQEWCGSSTAGGDHNVVFLGEAAPSFPYNARGEHNRTFVWNEDMKGASVELGRWPVEELWDAYIDDAESHLIIPHVGGRRYIPDWHHPELERLVEIASSWGHFDWLYRDVIARGYKLGVAASGDEHRGRPAGGAPGVQVFGVKGGLTGVIAEQLDRGTVARALRARHTWATTGERSAVLVRCGNRLQGDAFTHAGPATLDYRFLGDTGWEYVAAFDHTGPIWSRNLHAELGFSDRLIRVRWGGARIRDRYRWAAWQGRIRILNGTINRFGAHGLEHLEETVWREGATDIGFRSDTYGDADSIEIDVSNLAKARIVVEGTIDGFVKVGDPLAGNPFAHAPTFHWETTGAELLAQGGALQFELGGTELFIALERLTEASLPADLAGHFTVAPENGPFGHRPVYFFGRQRNDAKVWSSAQFITFE